MTNGSACLPPVKVCFPEGIIARFICVSSEVCPAYTHTYAYLFSCVVFGVMFFFT